MLKVLLTSIFLLFTVSITNTDMVPSTNSEAPTATNEMMNMTKGINVLGEILPFHHLAKTKKCRSSSGNTLIQYWPNSPPNLADCEFPCVGGSCCSIIIVPYPKHPKQL